MAKLYASEVALKCSLESMRIHGAYGYSGEFIVERLYRDVPLMANPALHDPSWVRRSMRPLAGIVVVAVEQAVAAPICTRYSATSAPG